MKKTIIATILSLVTTPCFAAVTMECTAKSLKVRQLPVVSSLMIGGIMNGEKVTFIEKSGKWTKIQLKQGKEGYVFSSYLKDVEEDMKELKAESAPTPSNEIKDNDNGDAKSVAKAMIEQPVEEERSILDNQPNIPKTPIKRVGLESAKTVLPHEPVKVSDLPVGTKVVVKPVEAPVPDAKLVDPPKMKTFMLATDRDKEDAIATLKATNEALLNDLAAMKQERSEMAALKREISENIRCVVKEREENEKRTAHAESMQKRAEAEVAEIKSTLVLGGHARLLTLADSGEKAYFKGVGEVNLAFEGGRTVLRVEEASSSKAEKALARSNPEKYLRNGFAYFVVDSKSLVF